MLSVTGRGNCMEAKAFQERHSQQNKALVCIESQLKHEQVLVSLEPAACRLHSLSDVRLHMGHNTSMTLHAQAARGVWGVDETDAGEEEGAPGRFGPMSEFSVSGVCRIPGLKP